MTFGNRAHHVHMQVFAGAIAIVFLSLPASLESSQAQHGTLELTFVDEASHTPTPVRVEILDGQGNGYVAEDALPVDGDCKDRLVPADLTLEQALGGLAKKVLGPHTNQVQFYSVGKSRVTLPVGEYKLKVYKGPEYNIQKREIQIEAGEMERLAITMSRWVNMPEQGWYSADDHLHIARPVKELNPYISKWMQAEDIHVANLLQWGLSRAGSFHNTLQYAFGKDSVYREGDYILATGQENPRTHFMGHIVILGGKTPINLPENYLIYRLFLEEAKRQKAASGFGHFAASDGGVFGAGVVVPTGLLDFVEIMQFDQGFYDVWYDMLNLGFRTASTAGTDYPCSPNVFPTLPGRERFYTRIDGQFDFDAWIDGIHRGRTFATNGPMLEFHVNGKEIGDEITLKKGSVVFVEGRVRFDSNRDAINRLEVILNGEAIRSFPLKGAASDINFRFDHKVDETSWMALRASGKKLEEGLQGARTWIAPSAMAHSAPIYLTLKDGPPLRAHPRAKALARKWLARLEDLEARLADDQIPHLKAPPTSNQGVNEELLRKNQETLLKEIKSAKDFFQGLMR